MIFWEGVEKLEKRNIWFFKRVIEPIFIGSCLLKIEVVVVVFKLNRREVT